MVATPMYGGQSYGLYTKSSIELAQFCSNHNIPIRFNYVFNESLITRARNYLVELFLKSDCTHLVFIDADIEFDPKDVLALVALDKDVVAGPYPKKQFAWEKIHLAAKTLDLQNSKDLSKFGGDFVFNFADKDKTKFDITEPQEVLEVGTGFMAIKRETFAKFKEAYPHLEYRPDHARTSDFDGSRMIHAYFETVIDPKSKRYLSEDYMFCQYVRNAGMSVWLCPWMSLKHIGQYVYDSDIRTLTNLPNANLTSIQKT